MMSNSNPIRILTVDDNPSVREGIRIVIESLEDLELIAEASNGTTALTLCARRQPDVVLMDLVTPGMDGIITTYAIHQAFPNVRIIILSSAKDREMVKDALDAGAIGYIQKNVSAQVLAKAIRAAHAGRGIPATRPDSPEVQIRAR